MFTGPTLTNHLMIHQSVTLPEIDLTHTDDKSKIEIPRGLKQRWKPFGYSKYSHSIDRWDGRGAELNLMP